MTLKLIAHIYQCPNCKRKKTMLKKYRVVMCPCGYEMEEIKENE